ncbi:hypothetical protein BC829DRAFT_446596 [Chytridium lagenaria]|nr:hypothetical protein BC829DRAFT_446596 [Chytridium lagenaria]
MDLSPSPLPFSSLSTIPTEVLTNILKYLRPAHVLSISVASSRFKYVINDVHLWTLMLSTDSGRSAYRHQRQMFRRLNLNSKNFVKLSVLNHPANLLARLYVTASELSIAWLDNEHWSLEESVEQSISPKTAVLNSVCWLDVSATLRAVPSGLYIPYLRLRLNDSSSLNDVLVTCTLNNTVLATRSFDDFLSLKPSKSSWLLFPLPMITVPESKNEFTCVQISIVDHGVNWKMGPLYLDAVGLEPARRWPEEGHIGLGFPSRPASSESKSDGLLGTIGGVLKSWTGL